MDGICSLENFQLLRLLVTLESPYSGEYLTSGFIQIEWRIRNTRDSPLKKPCER
jgi:hypothetical protein